MDNVVIECGRIVFIDMSGRCSKKGNDYCVLEPFYCY